MNKECYCGRFSAVNDEGRCKSCHYNMHGMTVDAGQSQFNLLKALKAEAHIFGYESLMMEMDKIYNELKWEVKQKDA